MTAPNASALPYDRSGVSAAVVHIGVGGFHRAHQAMFHDRLLAAGATEWGICGAGVLAGDKAMADALRAQDCLYTLMTKAADGGRDVSVIGALTEYLFVADDPEPLVARMADPGTRIVSMTVTEGGYTAGNDTFALIADALARRRDAALDPFTVMSCDNLEGNGTRARETLLARIEDDGLHEWVAERGAFPQSMVDRITPGTTDADREELSQRFEIDDRWPVVCEPFVQWVLEDAFAAGRPDYASVGVQIVDDVRPFELMKLRLLNAGHQAIAYLGLAAGLERVDEAAVKLGAVLRGWHDEALPTLPDVPDTDLATYAATVRERCANPAIADTLARLAEHGSDRIPPWVVPVIRENLETGRDVRAAATVVAGWCRFCEKGDIVDRRAEALTERARRGGEAFIADRELFGDLADASRFVDAFNAALVSLRERGVHLTVATLGGPADEGI